MEGVAVPSNILQDALLAISRATSLALYLGAGSYCLNEGSCSSSTIINPRSLKGRNIDDLTPRITLKRPSLSISCHTSTLSPSQNLHRYTPSSSPKCDLSLFVIWVVRATAGSRYKACLPLLIVSSIR